MERLVLIAFGLIILQYFLTFLQIKAYRNKIKDMKKYGFIGIGSRKSRVSAGNITILAADSSGKITRCETMQGVSVFARFKEVGSLVGRHINEVKGEVQEKEDIKNKNKRKSNHNLRPHPLLQAIAGIEVSISRSQIATENEQSN